MADGDLRRGTIGHGRIDGADQIVGELLAIVDEPIAVLRPEEVHALQARPDDRTGMGVRRVEHDLGALQAVPGLESGGDFFGKLVRQADQVGGDEDHAAAAGVFDRQGLGPEIVDDALRGMIARGIAGQPDRAFGRDGRAADAHFEVRCRRGGGRRRSRRRPWVMVPAAAAAKKRRRLRMLLMMVTFPAILFRCRGFFIIAIFTDGNKRHRNSAAVPQLGIGRG